MVANVYDYVYYKLYCFTLLTPSKNEEPHYIAGMVLALLVCSNILTIIFFLDDYSVDIANVFLTTYYPYVVLYLSILAINYFRFIHSGWYTQLEKKYKKESEQQNLWGSIATWVYTITTFVLMIYFATPG